MDDGAGEGIAEKDGLHEKRKWNGLFFPFVLVVV
jgi:hypothetical protein